MSESKISKKRILTGDRPTGPLHLGHYIGTLKNRVKLQDEYDCFFIIADYQVLTDHLNETENIPENIRQIVIDYLSVGIDPKKSSVFIQSAIPEIAELTMFFSMFVSLARVKRNPTVKEEMKGSGIKKEELSYGFIGYPISQAADILIVRANLVPVGQDQVAHLEQTREVARNFNRIFKKVFPIPEVLVGEVGRLSGIDRNKMSKSKNNAIYLSDSVKEVEKKVMQAYTDPTRLRATDPGHIEGNVVFEYLDAFHENKSEVEDMKDKYRKGLVGDVAVKKILANTLNDFLEPIRKRRKDIEENPKIVEETLQGGIENTRKEARATMALVKEAMHFNYDSIL